MSPKTRPSPLALAVLSLLEVGPLHPYGMQRLIKLWGKDLVINVGQRATLYQTIRRLHEAGLIAVLQTEREQQFPERTVYELTEAGRSEARRWLNEMLATPRNEFPEFPAALSFAMLLGPEGTLVPLEARAEHLREQLAELDRVLGDEYAYLPRVTLLETEYLRALTAAELEWVSAVSDDLRSGALSWSAEELAALANDELPDSAAGED